MTPIHVGLMILILISVIIHVVTFTTKNIVKLTSLDRNCHFYYFANGLPASIL